MTGTPEGSTKSDFMEKPGIEPATPGFQGIVFVLRLVTAVRGVPDGKIKVRRGWVWEGVSPSHTLGKKNQNMN